MSGSHPAPRRGNGTRHLHHHADPHPHDPQRADPGGRAATGMEARSRLCRRGLGRHDRPRGDRVGAGVSFADSTGASIPIAGFAQLTLVFSLVGVGIAAVMARKARRPRATFVRTAVALTALSFVPDLTFGFDAGSAATLITLHTVAAAIVVPTLARRLARAR
jgi:hypothetical protein